MKEKSTASKPSFMTKNKDLLVVGGVIVVLAGSAFAYYYYSKKKEKKKSDGNTSSPAIVSTSSGTASSYQTPPFVPLSTTSSSSGGSKPSGYPIKYGSRHPDVKTLQRYLKIYKEDLGRSGTKKDGVDGIFGPKTARASKKRLNKTVFTQADIAGMRKALLSLGK